MLPAYLGLYLASGESRDGFQTRSYISLPMRRLGRALLVGGVVTAGFIVLFSIAGAVIGIGAHSILESVTPWFGLGIGVVLALVGAWLLGGGKLYTRFAARAAAHIGDSRQVNIRGYFLFGLGYGVASLSCTLTIFLAVVGTSLAVSSIPGAVGQFVLYAIGMGSVIMALTVGTALFKRAMVGKLQKALSYVQPVGSWFMVLAGSYIVFYWLTMGGLM
jgi:cytochrome c biogenesis protein CcdA